MLKPDYLYYVSDRVVELYEQLNIWAVKDICRRLVNADFQFTGSIDWQIYKLQQSGMHLDEVVKQVAQITRKSEQEIADIFKEATYKSQAYDNEVYRRAGLTPIDMNQSPQMLKILQATYGQTMGEFRNFTKTTANASQGLFLDTMDEMYFRVMSGQQSYTEAVRQAVNTVSSTGVVIRYPTGHKDTIETAVRRCIITGVGQATARVSIQNAEELGTDLVLVSAHLGARPEHAQWQGKVYSISGSSKKYRKLSEATGYGTVEGLCGANCRHHFMPYIDGVSNNPYGDFNTKENKKYYDNQQNQRKRERDIRTTKRELQALEEAMKVTKDEKLKFVLQQDYDRKAAKLKRQNMAYKEYCKDKGLTTQQERLQVAGWGHKSSSGAREAAKRYQDSLVVTKNKPALKESIVDDTIKVKDSLMNNLPKIADIRSDADIKTFAEQFIDNLMIDRSNIQVSVKGLVNHGQCCFNSTTNQKEIHYSSYELNANDKRAMVHRVKTVFHESFHLSADGREWDGLTADYKIKESWKSLEETFTESSAHYLLERYGVVDKIAPSYAKELVWNLPRLKQIDKYSSCTTIQEFGKIAFTDRASGGNAMWMELSKKMKRVKLADDYYSQYYSYINAHEDELFDMWFGNAPGFKTYRERMKHDLRSAMQMDKRLLSDNQKTVYYNIMACAMQKVGVK